jgi:hypothetical protein
MSPRQHQSHHESQDHVNRDANWFRIALQSPETIFVEEAPHDGPQEVLELEAFTEYAMGNPMAIKILHIEKGR